MTEVNKETLKRLVQGTLEWEEAKKLVRLKPKDEDRFIKYKEVLQELVPWKEEILLRVSDHLYIVRKGPRERIVKCECGHEYGDYRINWKLKALIHVRRTKEQVAELWDTELKGPEPGWGELREYFCPGCGTQHAVESVPPGYPIMFEMLPDLDSFYRERLGQPLSDESPEWFQDKTHELTAQWVRDPKTGSGG
ncbi:MAG: acetone carboxylase subunit gamma [Candidatus Tectomicrobia bacterium]|uniref:Acetone carboxylase subunit gamma n=1 Tax=Tectimicrobiota bacterium TaxID=2528274 RepID=A0A932CQ81_UNCTE|nr:acetone carboxylase subunit gamma [Candidatus Tectomicrobia bacterium]